MTGPSTDHALDRTELIEVEAGRRAGQAPTLDASPCSPACLQGKLTADRLCRTIHALPPAWSKRPAAAPSTGQAVDQTELVEISQPTKPTGPTAGRFRGCARLSRRLLSLI